MKKVLSISVLLTIIGIINLSAQVQTFQWQGVQRQYIVRVPDNPSGPMPVVFFLHGLGDNVTNCDQSFNFSWLANHYGWVIVTPQARNEGLGTMWNVGLLNSSTDDAGFLMALLDTLETQYSLNPDSVFFTGFSMGGFMTHRMAIEHGDRITACAPVSGVITNSLASQTPVAPVRMLHIHGTSDNVVGYNGYSSTFSMTLGLGVDAIIDYWKTANSCEGDPTIDSLPDLANDGLRFVRYTYDCGTDLQLLKVIGGTHDWYDNGNQYDVSYMDIIYNFFKGTGAHSGIDNPERKPLKLWPNPTNGLVSIEVENATDVSVMDVQGRVVSQHELQAGTSQLDLRHLPAGIYFVKEQSGATMKVVVE